jgi:hypothetical protein
LPSSCEEWDAEGLHYETLAICRLLALARAVLPVAIVEKPTGWVHDPEPHPRREAAPGKRLVRTNPGLGEAPAYCFGGGGWGEGGNAENRAATP